MVWLWQLVAIILCLSCTLSDTKKDDCSIKQQCLTTNSPVSCQIAGQTFKASNECLARQEAKTYACKNQMDFNSDQVKCQPRGESQATISATKQAAKTEGQISPTLSGTKVPVKPNGNKCKSDQICTFEYRPSVCSYLGKEYSGSNRCHAMGALRRANCLAGRKVDEKKVSCKFTKGTFDR